MITAIPLANAIVRRQLICFKHLKTTTNTVWVSVNCGTILDACSQIDALLHLSDTDTCNTQ